MGGVLLWVMVAWAGPVEALDAELFAASQTTHALYTRWLALARTDPAWASRQRLLEQQLADTAYLLQYAHTTLEQATVSEQIAQAAPSPAAVLDEALRYHSDEADIAEAWQTRHDQWEQLADTIDAQVIEDRMYWNDIRSAHQGVSCEDAPLEAGGAAEAYTRLEEQLSALQETQYGHDLDNSLRELASRLGVEARLCSERFAVRAMEQSTDRQRIALTDLDDWELQRAESAQWRSTWLERAETLEARHQALQAQQTEFPTAPLVPLIRAHAAELSDLLARRGAQLDREHRCRLLVDQGALDVLADGDAREVFSAALAAFPSPCTGAMDAWLDVPPVLQAWRAAQRVQPDAGNSWLLLPPATQWWLDGVPVSSGAGSTVALSAGPHWLRNAAGGDGVQVDAEAWSTIAATWDGDRVRLTSPQRLMASAEPRPVPTAQPPREPLCAPWLWGASGLLASGLTTLWLAGQANNDAANAIHAEDVEAYRRSARAHAVTGLGMVGLSVGGGSVGLRCMR